MARRWKLGLLGAALSAGAAACATLAGLGDYQEGNPAVDGSVGDGAIASDVSTDAGIDVPQLAPCGVGYVCFEQVPNWQGPFEVAENPVQPDAGPPPVCPDGGPPHESDKLTGLVIPDASCGCACQMQASCAATIEVANGTACGSGCGNQSITSSGCMNLNCTSTTIAVEAFVADASCTPSSAPSIPDASFATSAYSCGTVTVDSGACEAGTLCAALPDQGFKGLCIRQEGDNLCPDASPYAYQHVYYQGLDDSRSCTGCGCAVTEGATCNYQIQFYSTATGCSSDTNNVGNIAVISGACQSNPSPFSKAPLSAKVPILAPASSGACEAGGAYVTGEAGPDPTYAVTYCCTE